jgi:hypothetical protein
LDSVRGDGHGLVNYLDAWTDVAAAYLHWLDETVSPPRHQAGFSSASCGLSGPKQRFVAWPTE